MLILNKTQLQAFDLHFLFKIFEIFIILMIQQDCASTVHSFLISQAVLMNCIVSFTFLNFNQQKCFLIESSATTFLK